MLDGVAITGGEPTCSPGIIDFVKKIKKMGFDVKFDSNGSNPDILKELMDKKLIDYIAMDVKAPIKKYKEIVRTTVPVKRIKESIDLIISSSIPHEFRTTLYSKLTVEDFGEMAKLIPGEKWFLQEMDPTHAYEGSVRKMKPMKKEKIDKILKVTKELTKVELRS